MTNTTTEHETAPWRSDSKRTAVRWVHFNEGWRFWAFERISGEDIGRFVSKAAAIRACLKFEREAA